MKSRWELGRLLAERHDSTEDVEKPFEIRLSRAPWYRQRHSLMLLLALAISLGFNALSMHGSVQMESVANREPTAFGNVCPNMDSLFLLTRPAHLEWNRQSQFVYSGLYASDNETAMDEAWETLNYDDGLIALDYEYAKSMGLPKAQPFPWDDSKGLYFINIFHTVHCLKSIRSTMLELRDNRPISYEWGHVMHCFETVLHDLKCYADDTPRYLSYEHPGKPGWEQQRQCRDWDQLVSFAKEHYSCWRDIEPTNTKLDPLLRYRYCPEGSPYREYVHAVFEEFDEDADKNSPSNRH